MYDSSQKYRWDDENVREYEIKLAKENAIKEAEKKVLHNIAKKCKDLGFSIKDISIVTQLSEEEIKEL